MQKKNFRKRSIEDDQAKDNNNSEDEEERRLALEEVKFLQKQRERKLGIPAIPTLQTTGVTPTKKVAEKNEVPDGDKEELVLQDTFAQETAVMVEDPNMLKYVEQELAKKRGRNIDATNQVGNDLKRADDELYVVPEHLKTQFNTIKTHPTYLGRATGRKVGFVLGVLSYPRISSSVPRSAIPARLSPLLAVDRRLLGLTMSRRSTDSQDTVVNSEEINYPKI
ncbi:Protein COP1 suppressor 2 [Vitis vinifera]|uniref:Protein COP1 suppressor 2 n=1 Tax=Vitis vinifera TaxID=29760 RepID=A0A438E1J4_VITVI|nr:Protein COP1 suppressor 2 [Vitis vinifera]